MCSQDGFIKVDHDYVMSTARVAKEKGCRHFHLVSSSGADKNSWFLYPKVKVCAVRRMVLHLDSL